MRTPQAEAFGFPNPLLGIIGFTLVLTTGVALLAGARLPRWYWVGLHTGALLGILFVHWLMFESLYVIGALCPYCMVVWVVMIPVFWYTTLHNWHHDHLPAPRRGLATATKYHGVVVTIWYALITVAVLQAFWTYWVG